jgi:hypothetical protein
VQSQAPAPAPGTCLQLQTRTGRCCWTLPASVTMLHYAGASTVLCQAVGTQWPGKAGSWRGGAVQQGASSGEPYAGDSCTQPPFLGKCLQHANAPHAWRSLTICTQLHLLQGPQSNLRVLRSMDCTGLYRQGHGPVKLAVQDTAARQQQHHCHGNREHTGAFCKVVTQPGNTANPTVATPGTATQLKHSSSRNQGGIKPGQQGHKGRGAAPVGPA